MFWVGLTVGLIIGAVAGLYVFAFFASRKQSDSCRSSDPAPSELRYAVCKVVTIDACLIQ